MRTVTLVVLVLLLKSIPAEAVIAGHMNEIVSKVVDSCTAQVRVPPEEDLTNVSLSGPSADKQKMQRVLGKLASFPMLKGKLTNIQVTCTHSIPSCAGEAASNRGLDTFNGCKSGNTITLKSGNGWSSMVHEIGHIIGARSFYGSYGKKNCQITTYAQQSSGEEFAEVFAAYVFAPRKLKQICPDAYDFMKNNVFGLDNIEGCEAGNTAGGGTSPGNVGGINRGGSGAGMGPGSPLGGMMGINMQDLMGLAGAAMQIKMQMDMQKEMQKQQKALEQQQLESQSVQDSSATMPREGVGPAPLPTQPGVVLPDSYDPGTPPTTDTPPLNGR